MSATLERWQCFVCGQLGNRPGAVCVRCALPYGAKSYPAYDMATGQVVYGPASPVPVGTPRDRFVVSDPPRCDKCGGDKPLPGWTGAMYASPRACRCPKAVPVGTPCDYAKLPHLKHKHGPGIHSRGGYTTCDACYQNMRAAEADWEKAQDAANYPVGTTAPRHPATCAYWNPIPEGRVNTLCDCGYDEMSVPPAAPTSETADTASRDLRALADRYVAWVKDQTGDTCETDSVGRHINCHCAEMSFAQEMIEIADRLVASPAPADTTPQDRVWAIPDHTTKWPDAAAAPSQPSEPTANESLNATFAAQLAAQRVVSVICPTCATPHNALVQPSEPTAHGDSFSLELVARAIDAESRLAAVTAELDALRTAGQWLSNVAYNMAQDSKLSEDRRDALVGGYKRWDAASRPSTTTEPANG